MLKLCSYSGCKEVVEVDVYDRNPPRCPKHPFTFTPKKVYKHHFHNNKHIYSSGRWKRLRAQYVSIHPLCEMCEKDGFTTPVCDVDHIKEISDGGDPFDINNLMSLCRYHHINKTIAERKKREDDKNGFFSISDFK